MKERSVSFTDEQADVQPEEGQGQSQQDSPYAEYLSRIEDEQARSVAEEGFKAFDASATKKFQEHADYRKSWAPFEQLGVNQREPESVAYALQLAELAQNDPQQFIDWVNGGYAEQAGIQQQSDQQQFDEFAMQDPQALEQLLEQRLEQRLSPLQQMLEQYGQRFEQQDQQQAEQEASRFIEGQIAELQEKHGDEFDRDAVELFIDHFANQAQSADELKQVVPKAFEALQGLRNKYEKAAFQPKVGAPAPAEGGGVPNMSQEKITSLRGPGSAQEEAARLLAQFRSQ